VGILVIGLTWSVHAAIKISAETLNGKAATLQALPVAGFNLLATVGLMALLI
jgi:hypothetical protein